MEAEDEEWVQQALIAEEVSHCAAKVISLEAKPAVGKGDNYGSDLKRLTLTVVTKSGELEERHLIYKTVPGTEHRRLLTKKSGVFSKEARMFRDVLSELEFLRKEKETGGELLWPRFFGAKRKYEGLLFEDLSASGFKMADRQKGLDFEHSCLVMESLAKFHALAAVLKERGDLCVNDFSSALFTGETEAIDSFYKKSLNDLAEFLENKWKGEWIEYATLLRRFAQVASSKVQKSFEKDETKFCTMNHGDCWINNLMFRYGKKFDPSIRKTLEQPEALRFIDFQLSHYNNPGLDLQYFLQTSLSPDTRWRKSELVRVYFSSLVRFLRSYGYPEDLQRLARLEDIQALYQKAAPFGLCTALITMPLMMAPAEKAIDMEEYSKKWNNKKETSTFSCYDNQSECFVNSLKHVLIEAKETGLLC